jgi:hypothetical protein
MERLTGDEAASIRRHDNKRTIVELAAEAGSGTNRSETDIPAPFRIPRGHQGKAMNSQPAPISSPIGIKGCSSLCRTRR